MNLNRRQFIELGTIGAGVSLAGIQGSSQRSKQVTSAPPLSVEIAGMCALVVRRKSPGSFPNASPWVDVILVNSVRPGHNPVIRVHKDQIASPMGCALSPDLVGVYDDDYPQADFAEWSFRDYLLTIRPGNQPTSGSVTFIKGVRGMTAGALNACPKADSEFPDVSWIADLEKAGVSAWVDPSCLTKRPPRKVAAQIRLTGGELGARKPRKEPIQKQLWKMTNGADEYVQAFTDTIRYTFETDRPITLELQPFEDSIEYGQGPRKIELKAPLATGVPTVLIRNFTLGRINYDEVLHHFNGYYDFLKTDPSKRPIPTTTATPDCQKPTWASYMVLVEEFQPYRAGYPGFCPPSVMFDIE